MGCGGSRRWSEHVTWTRTSTALLLCAAMSASLLHAADKRELDADFLEFLGSIDTEGEGWSEYL